MNVDGQSITLEGLFKEIVKNRQEIKNSIEASETRILLKFEELKTKINKLEKDNEILHNKIENIEKVTKKNNILIFGLNKDNKKVTTEFITEELKKLLDISLVESDFNNLYTLGKTDKSPIKIEFTSYLRKLQILKNCHKLKGTDISIVHDLTIKQRQENKILRRHLYLAKQDENKNCYIKNNKLYVNENVYTSQELTQTEEYGESLQLQLAKPNSAPPTPSRSTQEESQSQPSSELPATIANGPSSKNKPADQVMKPPVKKLYLTPSQIDKRTLRSNLVTK